MFSVISHQRKTKEQEEDFKHIHDILVDIKDRGLESALRVVDNETIRILSHRDVIAPKQGGGFTLTSFGHSLIKKADEKCENS